MENNEEQDYDENVREEIKSILGKSDLYVCFPSVKELYEYLQSIDEESEEISTDQIMNYLELLIEIEEVIKREFLKKKKLINELENTIIPIIDYNNHYLTTLNEEEKWKRMIDHLKEFSSIISSQEEDIERLNEKCQVLMFENMHKQDENNKKFEFTMKLLEEESKNNLKLQEEIFQINGNYEKIKINKETEIDEGKYIELIKSLENEIFEEENKSKELKVENEALMNEILVKEERINDLEHELEAKNNEYFETIEVYTKKTQALNQMVKSYQDQWNCDQKMHEDLNQHINKLKKDIETLQYEYENKIKSLKEEYEDSIGKLKDKYEETINKVRGN